MKPTILSSLLGLLSLALLALPSQAQMITYIGSSSGDQMPGSPDDYIFFETSNISGDSSVASGTSADNLTSFSYAGGYAVTTDTAEIASYSSIIPPGGTTAILTNALVSNGGGMAQQLVNGTNSSFNYNDFDVYVMVGNVGNYYGNTTINLTPYYPSATTPAEGAEDSYITWGTNAVDILSLSNNTDQNSAVYLEFQVVGLGSAADSPDLALTLGYTTENGVTTESGAYIGGVSFESIPAPEPSAYALIGLGLVGLFVIGRFRRLATLS